LEICLASGRSVTQLTREHRPPERRFLEFRMTVPRPELHARIVARTDAMIEAGWIDEVEALLRTADADQPGFATLGYPHVVAHLRGALTRDEMRQKIIVDTRRLARHQEVWFRKTPNAVTLPVGDATNVASLRRRLEACPDLVPPSS
jgi:tRNA dimethylallyltransferase